MASTLIVEDGTGLSNASSFVSAADIRSYALARGITLAPDDVAGDALVDQMAIKAVDYLEAKRMEYAGWRFKETQRLSFPREGVPAEYNGAGFYGPTNGYENIVWNGTNYRPVAPLPQELIDAQCSLVMQIKAGVDLMPTQVSGQFVKREKLGPLETEYSEAVGVYRLPQMPMIDALLVPLLRSGGTMRSYRA